MIAYVPWNGDGDPRQPQGRPIIIRPAEVRVTRNYLCACIKARALGWPTRGPVVAEYQITRDPEWLVDMAINRRAGWPDDPSFSRGSCMPVNGKYPKRAEEDGEYSLVRRLSRQLADRIIVWRDSLGGVPRKIRERIEHRLHDNDERRF